MGSVSQVKIELCHEVDGEDNTAQHGASYPAAVTSVSHKPRECLSTSRSGARSSRLSCAS